jgi:hypothetical protein
MSAVGADGTRGARSNDNLAIEIKPVLLPVSRPSFLDGARLRRRSDPESTKRQDHGTNADVRVCALAHLPTARTLKDRGTDVPLSSDPLKLRVQFIAQFDECVAGHAPMPLHAQPLHHFGKPNSLRIARSHLETIVLREVRLSKGPRYATLTSNSRRRQLPLRRRSSPQIVEPVCNRHERRGRRSLRHSLHQESIRIRGHVKTPLYFE